MTGENILKIPNLITLTFFLSLTGLIELVNAQTWTRKSAGDYQNVVAIVKPHKTGNCKQHTIRADGRVFDALKGKKGSFLIVDQIVSLTGTIRTNNQGRKIWEVFYQPSRTTMWLNDCDLSIPRLVD